MFQAQAGHAFQKSKQMLAVHATAQVASCLIVLKGTQIYPQKEGPQIVQHDQPNAGRMSRAAIIHSGRERHQVGGQGWGKGPCPGKLTGPMMLAVQIRTIGFCLGNIHSDTGPDVCMGYCLAHVNP